MKRLIVLPILLLAGAAVADPDLDAVVARALAESPRLASARAEVDAARARADGAGALPDPRLQFTEHLEPVETRVGPQRRAWSLSQSLPWFGTLSQRRETRSAHADAAAARADQTALDLVAEVKTVWWELARLERGIETLRAHRALAAGLEETVRARYTAGSGRWADVLRTQIETARLDDTLLGLEDRRIPLRAALEALVGGPVDAAPELPDVKTLPALDEPVLRARLLAANPRLAAWAHAEEAARREGRLAALEGRPVFTLGVNWIQTDAARLAGVPDSGQDAVSASLAVSLPLWRGRTDAAVRAAAGGERAARNAGRDLADALGAELERALFEHREARRRHALHTNTLIPRAEETAAALRAAYLAGGGDYAELVDADRLQLELALARDDAVADALIQEADVDRLVAAPLSRPTNP